MAFEMKATQQVNVQAEFQDAQGNPATVDGVPTWQTDNSDILVLEPADDGLSCLVKASGMIGVARVQMAADADLGQGITAIIGSMEIEITPGQATTVTLTPGTAEEQEPPA